MVNDSIMYAEVFEILGYMKKEEVMRIPIDVLEYIKQERSKTYKSRIDKNDLFNPNNIDQRSINLLTWLMMDYMGTEEQRAEIVRIGKDNDRKREEAKKAKYSTDVFNVKEKNVDKTLPESIEEITDEKNLTIVEKNDSVFTQLVKFFKNLFKIKDK